MVRRGTFEKAGRQLLPSIAYGDAAGLPVETRSYDFIENKYGGVNKFIPVVDNSYVMLDFPEGTTSDDTQLSVAVSRALIKARGFDIGTMADEHVRAYRETPRDTTPRGRVLTRFLGGSTTESVQKIIGGVSPHESGSKEGTGNGVLIKWLRSSIGK